MANIFTRRLVVRTVLTLREKCILNRSVFRPHVLQGVRSENRSLTYFLQPSILKNAYGAQSASIRCYSSNEPKKDVCDDVKIEEKLSLFKRFKKMYRDYWYVLLPVHLVTSAAWYGGFYYMAKSGIDIVGILESWNMSAKITNSLKDSDLGYFAIAYGLYKIATPLRYTVTLGGTTISIKYLQEWGYLKPVPTAQQLKDMYKGKKTDIIDTMRGKRDELEQKKLKMKDKKNVIMKGFKNTLSDIKNLKNNKY